MPERIRARSRWRDWAAALLSRRRRLASRRAGLGSILAKPRTAGRTLRELRLLSSRNLGLQKINLAIQPLLRFELRPASPLLARSTHRIVERIVERRWASATVVERLRSLETAGGTAILPAAAKAPLALVLQRLREPGRGLATVPAPRNPEAPEARPAPARQQAARLAALLAEKSRRQERLAPAAPVRVVAKPAAAAERDGSFPAAPWGPEPFTPALAHAAADPWRAAPHTITVPSPPPPVDVEAVADRVMQQIDRRLHAWRERRGGF